MPGTLYVVGTPIGNLEDLSPRAARVLRQVPLVAAEDTRVARRLLNRLDAHPRLISFHEHNWRERLEPILQALEEDDAALVSDAGMPGVSDPGRELVAAAAAKRVRIESVPGPSAVTTALAVSGLPAGAFTFLGFLPRRRSERQARLREAAASPFTLVLFEAPHRLRAILEDIAAILGDRPMAVCRELTKLHEEVFRGTPSEALEHFPTPRGEFVLVVAGAAPEAPPEDDADSIRLFLLERRAAGVGSRDAVAEAARRFGIPRNRAYQYWLETSPADRE
ncbi:MAG: 16S rRNA (cytidine(1402)-2'-O)-methyltransferase [Chloroflexi bacterium]|nr:16S rRNA (cytidine(1402)-2'-O)-methyltransferase [Chloroflexota bacterium]MYE40286.1 16S rRNA (cytidine(1402)-2'-O)-methyltransferase [Chloroflexota bacterium]